MRIYPLPINKGIVPQSWASATKTTVEARRIDAENEGDGNVNGRISVYISCGSAMMWKLAFRGMVLQPTTNAERRWRDGLDHRTVVIAGDFSTGSGTLPK
jgi:hypothetical protein